MLFASVVSVGFRGAEVALLGGTVFACRVDRACVGYTDDGPCRWNGLRARPRPEAQMDALFGDGWPAFIAADRTVGQYMNRVREHFPYRGLVLVDDEDLANADWAVRVR